jgi:hypothetical protein
MPPGIPHFGLLFSAVLPAVREYGSPAARQSGKEDSFSILHVIFPFVNHPPAGGKPRKNPKIFTGYEGDAKQTVFQPLCRYDGSLAA